MTSKKICKQCWIQKWGKQSWKSERHDDWKCALGMIFKIYEEKDPPNDCPYYLEHLMDNQNAK